MNPIEVLKKIREVRQRENDRALQAQRQAQLALAQALDNKHRCQKDVEDYLTQTKSMIAAYYHQLNRQIIKRNDILAVKNFETSCKKILAMKKSEVQKCDGDITAKKTVLQEKINLKILAYKNVEKMNKAIQKENAIASRAQERRVQEVNEELSIDKFYKKRKKIFQTKPASRAPFS